MDQELQNQLFEKYPDLFSNKDKGIKSSCMAWGIECGNGWFDIISPLCWMIKQHEDNIRWRQEWKQKQNSEVQKDFNVSVEGDETEYFPVKFDQVKEKFGGLRVYFSGGDEYVEGLVSMAESFSYKICEVCGDRGKPNEGGWISTLCDKCRNQA
jgi:NADH pyrophosphatase NudC (nudix superfamily)